MVTTYNRHFDRSMIIIHPGEFYASREDLIISTVLGSCISIILHDPVLGYCGMNHFMLPGELRQTAIHEAASGRYGIQAMELLINDMLGKGSRKPDLVAKVFGGGHVIANDSTNSIPGSNIRFAFQFLESENIPLISHDTGGTCGRKILLFTADSRVLLKRFHGATVNKTIASETRYLKDLQALQADPPDITLF